MNWLIFGASSFSGSNLCRYLRERGHTVEERSLRDATPPEPLPKVDVVVNFAALNVVAPSWAYWRHYMRVNVLLTGMLFDALVDNPPGLYIHVSTPEVYGNVEGLITESQPFNPSTPYAVSRAAAEMLLKTYQQQYGLKAIVTRACNVYGPGQQHYRLIPKLVACIKMGIRFPLEGGGGSRRSWVYVDDLCTAYEKIAHRGEAGEVYHITDQQTWSVREVVEAVCEYMSRSPDDVIEEAPERPGKDSEYWLGGDLLRWHQWRPRHSLWHGITRTIDWMTANWDAIKDKPMDYEVRL